MKVLEIIIGQEVANINPYTTNNEQPKVFIILKVFMFFIKKEIINTNDAK